jgi:hypothetical protein
MRIIRKNNFVRILCAKIVLDAFSALKTGGAGGIRTQFL